MTSDPEVLQIVNGYRIDFETLPLQYTVPKEIDFFPQEAEAVEAEVQNFLQKGIIKASEHEQGEFFSNIFPPPKKELGT